MWNEPLFNELSIESRDGMVLATGRSTVRLLREDLLPVLRATKTFLEELARINTVGKLRNLRLSEPQVREALDARQGAARIARLAELVAELQPLAAYLAEAQANLPPEHPWSERATAMRALLLDDIRRLGRGDRGREDRAGRYATAESPGPLIMGEME